ncbi:MarR family transcriptional regulator [Propionigenium maris DSM 9537]|jgi:DNA-binding MarR family transcriptional regulator|uniref:MarR family transcriptional regulator n=1 Tax=Propionigenium maris DSM 9537 TaxID=1123000 RepID=A0A9W6GKC3_9FUSO|nr:MarR family transcriptional regulator [Propionigenium maris]GLI55762.1 MarR family transcriptional regulator [Propionigenium maris DSM 9537]
MVLNRMNEVIEDFYKLFYETEDLALKQGIKCLTHTELHVIEAIDTDSLTMNELSERLGITMGTATVAVTKLAEKGFILRERSDLDRRKVFVSLSKKGNEALGYHNNYHNMIISSITKSIDPKDMETFLNVFEAILKNLRNKIEYFKPDSITEFPKNSIVNIVEIKGTPIIKDFFKGKGIDVYSTLKITKNNLRVVTVELEDGSTFEINSLDAKNLIAVKKEV